MRPMGDILLDLETLLDEMVDDQGLQTGDIIALVHAHLEVHRPDAFEEYLDGDKPILYYGPRKGVPHDN